MANTTYGSPYVQSADLVSGWPATSLSVANRVDDVAMKGNGINAQTSTTYTTVLTDAGKTITTSNASPITVTIPASGTVNYSVGTVIQFLNIGVGALTIAATGGVTINNNTGTVAQYSAYSIIKTATDTWYAVSGGGIPKASYSATTGSPTITTVGGKSCLVYNASGSVTLTAGLMDVLIIGGGGAGYLGGGGAGAHVYMTSLYFAAGTHTITVGAGGSGTGYNSGNASLAGPYIAPGGGGGAARGQNGGSGGGSYYSTSGAGLSPYGNNGGTGSTADCAGGGGGAGAAGASVASGTTGGAGGNGTANSITGSSVTRAGGGGGYGSGAGGTAGSGGATAGGTTGATSSATANTGSGSGGSGGGNGNGGSGVVILLIG